MENVLLWGAACGHSDTSCKLLGRLGQPTVSGETCLSLLYPRPLLAQAQNALLQEGLSPFPPFHTGLLRLDG